MIVALKTAADYPVFRLADPLPDFPRNVFRYVAYSIVELMTVVSSHARKLTSVTVGAAFVDCVQLVD